MSNDGSSMDPSTSETPLDAVIAAPKDHQVPFENNKLRVLEVMLEANEEKPMRLRSFVFVLDRGQVPVHHMAPQPLGRVLNASDQPIHGIRVGMKPQRRGRAAAQARDRGCRGGGFAAARNRPLTAQICRALLRPDALGSDPWDPIDPP
jgi:hypothetical protein